MATISQVLLASRVLSFVLGKYFGAKGKGIGEKADSAEAQLGPSLTSDLKRIAKAEAAAKHSKLPTTPDFDETVDRVWRGLRKRNPEVAAEEVTVVPEVAAPAPVVPAQQSGGSGWVLAIALLFLAVLMTVMHE